MTFLEIQDAVMNRLNLTSTDARTRIKSHINLRHREAQTTINLTRSRRGTKTWTTTSGTATVSGGSIAKVLNLRSSGSGAELLEEISFEQIRQLDPSESLLGTPRFWAVKDHRNDVVVLQLQPIPDATLTLYSDTVAAGTTMTADADVPTIPVDFHDALVNGAMADELMRMEKYRQAQAEEAKFHQRLADLRYFMHKNAYEARRQGETMPSRRRVLWPNNTL